MAGDPIALHIIIAQNVKRDSAATALQGQEEIDSVYRNYDCLAIRKSCTNISIYQLADVQYRKVSTTQLSVGI